MVVIVSAKLKPALKSVMDVPPIIFPIANKKPDATTIGRKKEIAVIKCFLISIFLLIRLTPFRFEVIIERVLVISQLVLWVT